MSEIKFLEKLTNHLEKLPGVGKKTAPKLQSIKIVSRGFEVQEE